MLDDQGEGLERGTREVAGQFIRERGMKDVDGDEPFDQVRLPDAPTSMDLGREGITSVLWATGFRRSYPWLRVPVFDRRGEIRHQGGVTPHAGLYVMGLNFLRRRSSSFIAGVGRDAEDLAEHMTTRASALAVA